MILRILGETIMKRSPFKTSHRVLAKKLVHLGRDMLQYIISPAVIRPYKKGGICHRK
jgi:hypothetical protein